MANERFLTEEQRTFARRISRIALANPFLPDRIEAEREAAGEHYIPGDPVWSRRRSGAELQPSLRALQPKVRAILEEIRAAAGNRPLLESRRPGPETDGSLLRNLVSYYLYTEFTGSLDEIITRRTTGRNTVGDLYPRLSGEYLRLTNVREDSAFVRREMAQEFALFFQIRRAFTTIYDSVIGESMPSARLRAAIWQSIFTHDMPRYLRSLHARMQEFTCLITGPSGTGKELVARAIAESRFIPFDAERMTFPAEAAGTTYLPINLPALSATLIESELFGHIKGSFTGAAQDRRGFFELATTGSTVFLDEIGDLDPSVQVKLLRVLQSRTFQRVGDWRVRHFQGKVVAATNRDLSADIRAGRFREDLFFRLCADTIATPSLREQLADTPSTLDTLVLHLADGLVGAEEGPHLADQSLDWIRRHMPRDYPWPGNVRELEQCVRNVLIRNRYDAPAAPAPEATGLAALFRAMEAGTLTADEVLAQYCRHVHSQTNNWQESARRLQLDHRTVKARVEEGRK